MLTAEKKPSKEPKPSVAAGKTLTEQKPSTVAEKPAKEQKPPIATEKAAPPKPGLAEATKARIRRDIADEKIGKVFNKLREQMVQYRDQWSQYEVAMIHQQSQKESGKGKISLPPAPPRPDFEKLAKENELSTGQCPLVSQWEARSLPIGVSLVGGRDPVWHYAFLSLARFRGGIHEPWRRLLPVLENRGD